MIVKSLVEMQTVTVTVLEKLKKCLEEIRTALGDLRTITGKPSLVSNVVGCVNTHPTNHVQTPQLVTDANVMSPKADKIDPSILEERGR